MGSVPMSSIVLKTASASACVPLGGAISKVTITLPGCVVMVMSSGVTLTELRSMITSAIFCLNAPCCGRKSCSVPRSVTVKTTPGCASPGCVGEALRGRLRGIPIASPTTVARSNINRNTVRRLCSFHCKANAWPARTYQGSGPVACTFGTSGIAAPGLGLGSGPLV